MSGTKTIWPDKYKTKYPDTPHVGKYNVERADSVVKPKVPSYRICRPTSSYKRPPEQRPEVNTKHLRPFGSGARGGYISRPPEKSLPESVLKSIIAEIPK